MLIRLVQPDKLKRCWIYYAPRRLLCIVHSRAELSYEMIWNMPENWRENTYLSHAVILERKVNASLIETRFFSPLDTPRITASPTGAFANRKRFALCPLFSSRNDYADASPSDCAVYASWPQAESSIVCRPWGSRRHHRGSAWQCILVLRSPRALTPKRVDDPCCVSASVSAVVAMRTVTMMDFFLTGFPLRS